MASVLLTQRARGSSEGGLLRGWMEQGPIHMRGCCGWYGYFEYLLSLLTCDYGLVIVRSEGRPTGNCWVVVDSLGTLCLAPF